MKNLALSFCAIIALSFSLLSWHAYERIVAFQNHKMESARASINIVASELQRLLFTKKQHIKSIFEKQNFGFDPSSPISNKKQFAIEYTNVLSSTFPDFLGYSVTGLSKEDLQNDSSIPDFSQCEELISDTPVIQFQQCRKPNGKNYYYYEVETPFFGAFESDVYSAKFDFNLLGQMLKNAVFHSQRVFIKDLFSSEIFELTTSDNGNIALLNVSGKNVVDLSTDVYQRKIDNSYWQIISLVLSQSYSEYKQKVIIQAILIFITLLLIYGLLFIWVKRKLELELSTKNEKSDIFSLISHEIRTPLTTIRATLSLVSNGVMGSIPEQIKCLIDMALNNCEQLVLLLNDLLDLQELEQKKIIYDKKPVNLIVLIKEIIASNAIYAEKYQTKFEFSTSLKNANVYADEARIQQAVTNLLSNAAKYGKNGEEITILLTASDTQIRVSVIDQGDGISEEFNDTVFDKCSQLTTEGYRAAGGTGLGLGIVKQIIEGHGGRVGFDSYTGVGSTFYFDLPLYQA